MESKPWWTSGVTLAPADIRTSAGKGCRPPCWKKTSSTTGSKRWAETASGPRLIRRHRTGGIEDEAFRAYADYMATDGFQQGVAKLLAIAGNRRTAIMCAEGDYRHCHRRFLCDHLLANDVSVQHIFPSGEVKPHLLTTGAKVVEGTVTYPGPATLFEM